jgi:sodium transport system ATP-binding protein
LRPTSGIAEVAGYNVATDPAKVRMRIGFMSGNTGVYDRMTAWEMVEYYGRLYGMPEEALQARLEELFETLQMNEIRDMLGSKMSTGNKQKVSIARTIVHDPPVMIFDEPTSGLDVLVARAVLEAIARLKDQGKCIIFSTHIMREVEKLCDRIAIIHKGRILAMGTVQELEDRYQESDMEEVFFDLIQAYEAELAAAAAEAG